MLVVERSSVGDKLAGTGWCQVPILTCRTRNARSSLPPAILAGLVYMGTIQGLVDASSRGSSGREVMYPGKRREGVYCMSMW